MLSKRLASKPACPQKTISFSHAITQRAQYSVILQLALAVPFEEVVENGLGRPSVGNWCSAVFEDHDLSMQRVRRTGGTFVALST